MRHHVPPIRADHFVSELWKNINFFASEFPHAVYQAPRDAIMGCYTRGEISSPIEFGAPALSESLPLAGCLFGVAILKSFPQLQRRLEYVDDRLQLNIRALYSELVAREWLTEQHLTDRQIGLLKAELRELVELHHFEDSGLTWNECVDRLGRVTRHA